jgi:hypothetical protein
MGKKVQGDYRGIRERLGTEKAQASFGSKVAGE